VILDRRGSAPGSRAASAGLTYAETIRAIRDLEDKIAKWPRVSIRILRNYTLENLKPLLQFECARYERAVDVSFSDFDTFEQEVIDPTSKTNTGHHDLIVLSLWSDSLFGHPSTFEADRIFDRVKDLLERLKENTSSAIAVTSFLAPAFALGGARVEQEGRSSLSQVARLNRLLRAYAQEQNRIYLIDMGIVQAENGAAATLDRRFWYLYKAPLRNEALAVLASELASIATVSRGAGKKVLVLDCDNTLWGGIVGEDGIEGISLDPEQYPGSAFYDFHRQVIDLKNQGVLVAICSKNNEADALAVLEDHPHSLLKKADLAGWQINWNTKVANLRELARQLNLGLDSFVFIDDDPAECAFVRKALPEVTVLEIPARPYDLPILLKQYRGFDRIGLTTEDATRTTMYVEAREREQARTEFNELEAYLESLKLVVEIVPAKLADISRIAQLTQKTNQFNLTTRRYTHGDVERFLSSPDHVVLTMRVRDRFGDYGVTGIGILFVEASTAHIDTFLMSCRVLGRHVEYALLNQLIRAASERSEVAIMKGYFFPTKKNQQVATFFERAGFAEVEQDRSDEPVEGKQYVADIRSSCVNPPQYLTILT
jgi:FkbH-like protein